LPFVSLDDISEIKKTKIWYDEIASKTEEIEKIYDQEFYDYISNTISLKQTSKVLDIGCGNGVLGKHIKKNCAFYVGLDLSFLSLVEFNEFESENKETNLLQGVTNNLPFINNHFDLIIMYGVSEHIPSEKILKKNPSRN